jgi:hypothetical protein
MMKSVFLTKTALLVLLAMGAAGPAAGQRFVQAGAGMVPGIGAQVGFVDGRAWYTAEVMLFVDAAVGFLGGEGHVQAATGLGGAVRAMGLARFFTDSEFNYDLDAGLRFGPSLFFAPQDSPEALNPFRLFIEPFGRFSTRLSDRLLVFGEVGMQRPVFRAGVWVPL